MYVAVTFLHHMMNALKLLSGNLEQHTRRPPMDVEFIGATTYVLESILDLLMDEPLGSYNKDSSKGSHQPSCECFIVETQTPKDHLEVILRVMKLLLLDPVYDVTNYESVIRSLKTRCVKSSKSTQSLSSSLSNARMEGVHAPSHVIT